MAVRYSGRVRVVVQWVDRTSDYRAVVSAPSVGGVRPEVMRIGHPPASRLAVDSPAAYDEAAGAAISFAREEFHELAQVNRAGTGWHLTRSAPRAKANPSLARLRAAERHREKAFQIPTRRPTSRDWAKQPRVQRRVLSLLSRRSGARLGSKAGLPADYVHSMLQEVAHAERVPYEVAAKVFNDLVYWGQIEEIGRRRYAVAGR